MQKIKSTIIFLSFYLVCFQSVVQAEFHHVDDCYTCHDFGKMFDSLTDPTANKLGIREVIQTPNSGDREVIFRDRDYSDDNFTDYADGDTLFNGICEVCHTVNNHHRNDGSDETEHFDGKRCTTCHLHENEFAPPVEQAHRTHLDYRGKGPLIQDCTVCHTPPIYNPGTTVVNPDYQFSNDVNYSVVFRDGNTLETTTACDNCHSPWGAYPGGVESEALMLETTGAKANFRTGIYENDGYTLKDGKEKWCITCHDDRPSTSKYNASTDAPPPTVFLDYTNTTNSAWSTENAWNGTVPFYMTDTWGPTNWIQYNPVNISQTGTYGVFMRWFGNNTSCTTDALALLVEVSSTGGSNESFRWAQPASSVDYLKIADFNITAGDVTVKITKDLGGCFAGAGDIKIEPSGGSGGAVVFAPMVAGDDQTWGFYATGHGVAGVECTECHDPRKKHIDYNYRTHEMNASDYGKVVNPWGDSYRLKTKDPKSGEAICARCHDFRMIWDVGSSEQGASRVRQTGFRQYANAWYENNYHASHMSWDLSDSSGQGADSDWNGQTDSSLRCANCHNVHGSTRGRMFRDGHLVSDPYTTSMMPMKDVDWQVFAKAKWQPTLQGGDYNVSIWYPAIAGAATNSPFYVKDNKNYVTKIDVNQTTDVNTWVSLGSYTFDAGTKGFVFVNNDGADGNIVADAVRFTSTDEDIIMDNGDANYTAYGTFIPDGAGNDGDSEWIANTEKGTDENALVSETTALRVPGVLSAEITDNKLCRSCHGGINEIAPRPAFKGPKILNRFEAKRWVMNDGSEDAEVYVTVQDTDSNITSVELDLTPIGGAVVNMNWVDKQNFSYTIPGSMINGLSDRSYKLPIRVYDPEFTVANLEYITHETYLFPKDSTQDAIYMDTNDVELYDVNDFRFAINTDFSADLPANTTYFGAGYRYNVADFNTSYGIWRPSIPRNGKYEVYAFWNEIGNSVKYTAHAADGTYEVVKNQKTNPSQWNYIGTYSFLDDDSGYVQQTSNDGLTMVADAMKFVRVNSEPLVRMSAIQLDKKTRIISTTDRVTLSAIGSDYDDDDNIRTLTYDWSNNPSEILDNGYVDYNSYYGYHGNAFSFDPSSLSVGFHEVQVTVTDSHGASTTVRLGLEVLASYPVLTATDTDGDGINDDVEGFTDFDEDGIPNYLDSDNTFNQIPVGSLNIVTEQSLEIRIGSTALAVGSNDSMIEVSELNASGTGGESGLFDGGVNVGGLFDFDIVGLKAVGQKVKVVIPLQGGVTIPVGATYQKYDANTGWTAYAIDSDNAIHSAASVAGTCPTPGDGSYESGLVAGYDCVQLTIQDGGPNDADGLANAEIKDPGGIFGTKDADTVQTDETEYISYDSGSGGGGGSGSFTLYSLLILGLFGIGAFVRRR